MHSLMSFIGYIGTLMADTGLSDIMSSVQCGENAHWRKVSSGNLQANATIIFCFGTCEPCEISVVLPS